jgi:hypothetical protein
MIERARVALTAKLRQSTESRISSYGCAYRPIRSWRVGDSSDPRTTRAGTFRWEKQARLRRFPADSRSFWQFHYRLFSGKTQINSLPLRKSKGQCSGAKFGTRDVCEIEGVSCRRRGTYYVYGIGRTPVKRIAKHSPKFRLQGLSRGWNLVLKRKKGVHDGFRPLLVSYFIWKRDGAKDSNIDDIFSHIANVCI